MSERMLNPDLSEYNLPSTEVRAIQAFLYSASMKQTLTLETLRKYRQYLDTYIKIVCCQPCSSERSDFEKCFSSGDRDEGYKLDDKINGIVELIKSGYCNCDAFHLSAKKVYGVRLIHTLVLKDSNLPLTAFLQECSCEFNVRTSEFEISPMIIAIKANQIETVRYLVQVGAKTKNDTSTPYVQGALELAVLKDNAEIVRILLTAKDIDVNVCDRSRLKVPLLLKCVKHSHNYIKTLLKAGADPNLSDSRGQTPLKYCALMGKTSVVELLIEYGADVNQTGDDNHAPLYHSTRRGDVDTAMVLLEAGADPNYREKLYGMSLIMLASYEGKDDLIKPLIKYGGDVNVLDGRLYSALHYAAMDGHTEIVKTLLEAGAVHDAQPRDKNTPLALSANGGHLDVMKILLPLGCDVNNIDKDNDTPLHYAAYHGMVEGIELLMNYGANPDVCNSGNSSVLWYAVYMRQIKIVQRLLAANVKIEISSCGRNPLPSNVDSFFYQTPKSPLYVAIERQSKDIVMLLINAGYNVHKETWLFKDDIPHGEENKELLQELTEVIHTPFRLVTICRNNIRQYLGRNVCQKVERLDIPRRLKNYLILKDLVEDVEIPISTDQK